MVTRISCMEIVSLLCMGLERRVQALFSLSSFIHTHMHIDTHIREIDIETHT